MGDLGYYRRKRFLSTAARVGRVDGEVAVAVLYGSKTWVRNVRGKNRRGSV